MVQGKTMHPIAHRQDQHGRRAVQRITGGHLLDALLQECFLLGGINPFGQPQNGKNTADADIHINIGRPIQRIE